MRLLSIPCVVLFAFACRGSQPDKSQAEVQAARSGPFGMLTPAPYLQGDAGDVAVHPEIGLEVSKRFVLVALNTDTNAEAFTDLLAQTGCVAAGTSVALGLVQLDCGASENFARVGEAVAVASAHPAVAAAALDGQLAQTSTPPPPTASGVDPDWQWRDGGGHNWGLKWTHAPQAWSLNRHIKRAGHPKVGVFVAESGFDATHPDFVDSLGNAAFVAQPSGHATGVAGIIAATWGNDSYIDGVSPFVSLFGHWAPPNYNGPYGLSFGSFIISIFTEISAASPAPRLVNFSVAYNWYRCRTPPTQAPEWCDPSGNIAAATACWPSIARAFVASEGALFALASARLNALSPTLFVAAAGNDSGTWAANAACEYQRLGDFPAHLASPFNWAATHAAGAGGENVIVAMAMTDQGVRSDYSNVGGNLYAPADGNYTLASPNGAYATTGFSGTSAAAPFVTGAAAFLLAIEPTLSNAELRWLLTDPSCSSAMYFEPERLLSVFLASMCIDNLQNRADRTPRVRTWLADMDDGTPDGFQRVRKPDTGPAMNPPAVEDDSGGDGRVDMRDFRRLRDTYWMLTYSVLPELAPAGNPFIDAALPNRKLDLNEDGRLYDPASAISYSAFERYPRAGLNADPFVSWAAVAQFPGGERKDLDVLMLEYVPSPEDPWPKETLPLLLHSADLHIRLQADDAANRADDALTAFSATAFELSFTGDAVAGDAVPADLSALGWRRTRALHSVVTTPLRDNVRVLVRPVCGDEVRAESAYTVQVTSTAQNTLMVGEDRVVWLRKQDIPFCIRDCLGSIINDAPFCTQGEPAPTGPSGNGVGEPPFVARWTIHRRETEFLPSGEQIGMGLSDLTAYEGAGTAGISSSSTGWDAARGRLVTTSVDATYAEGIGTIVSVNADGLTESREWDGVIGSGSRPSKALEGRCPSPALPTPPIIRHDGTLLSWVEPSVFGGRIEVEYSVSVNWQPDLFLGCTCVPADPAVGQNHWGYSCPN